MLSSGFGVESGKAQFSALPPKADLPNFRITPAASFTRMPPSRPRASARSRGSSCKVHIHDIPTGRGSRVHALGDIEAIAGCRKRRVRPDVQALFCRRRHQPRRPPPANSRPGRPAPAMGPGTLKAPNSPSISPLMPSVKKRVLGLPFMPPVPNSRAQRPPGVLPPMQSGSCPPNFRFGRRR